MNTFYLLQIFGENSTEVRLESAVAVSEAFAGLALLRLICGTLNVGSLIFLRISHINGKLSSGPS